MKRLKFFVMLLLVSSAVSAFAQDSLNVQELGRLADWGYCNSVEVVGDYAYCLYPCCEPGHSWLRIIDISDSAHPVVVGSLNTTGTAWGCAIAGDYAYVADDNSLRVVNIANPTMPVEVGLCETPGSAVGVAVSGNYAFVADGDSGLRVVNITNPASPFEVGFCDTPGGSAYRVAVSGNYAYVADYGGGLRVVNITNPVAPVVTGFCDTPGYAWGVAVSGNYAYVADCDMGLRVVDITNPWLPVSAGYYDTPGNALGVAVAGNYAYVADAHMGLRVVNISNGTTPAETGFYNISGQATDVAVVGNRAYVADWSYFGIYDCSRATSPIWVPRNPDSLVVRFAPERNRFELMWAKVVKDTMARPLHVDRYVVMRSDSVQSTAWDSIGVPIPPDTNTFLDSVAFSRPEKMFFYRVKAVKN